MRIDKARDEFEINLLQQKEPRREIPIESFVPPTGIKRCKTETEKRADKKFKAYELEKWVEKVSNDEKSFKQRASLISEDNRVLDIISGFNGGTEKSRELLTRNSDGLNFDIKQHSKYLIFKRRRAQ
jgi:hypothetical protein